MVLSNGNRAITSGESKGTGLALNSPAGLTLNAAGDKAYVTDTAADSLTEVDLSTGNRRQLSK